MIRNLNSSELKESPGISWDMKLLEVDVVQQGVRKPGFSIFNRPTLKVPDTGEDSLELYDLILVGNRFHIVLPLNSTDCISLPTNFPLVSWLLKRFKVSLKHTIL